MCADSQNPCGPDEDSENNQGGHWLKTMMMCFVRKNQPDGKGKGFWQRRDEMKDWNDNEKDRIWELEWNGVKVDG